MSTRVLVVEDHADSAEFLRLLLEPEGYLVKTAATAHQTREDVSAWKPDIILMDLMLPDVEGLVIATRTLVGEGFTVLAYTNDDLVTALRLEQAGASAVMPLASPSAV